MQPDDPRLEQPAIEQRLTNWQPSAAGLDRDALMFAAGQAATDATRPPAWRSGVIMAVLLCLGIGLGYVARGGAVQQMADNPPVDEQVTGGDGPANGDSSLPMRPAINPRYSYLALNQALRQSGDIQTVLVGNSGAAGVQETSQSTWSVRDYSVRD